VAATLALGICATIATSWLCMRLYMTVDGDSRDTTQAILESPAQIGWTSATNGPDTVACEFLDWPFHPDCDADVDQHLAAAREHEPEIAVAPDVDAGWPLDESLRVADQLDRHAETVVVVPKSVRPARVPDTYRVGVPVANYGGGVPWSLWDYRDHETHILGGGPRRQLTVARHLDSVASVDTSALSKICQYGEWDGGTQDAEHKDYRERLRSSLINYHDVLQQL